MSSPESVLVARLSALGDVVLASGVAGALRERFPSARIDFLSQEPHGRILRWVPGLDAVHLWAGQGPSPPAARERRWDVVVDLSGTARSRRVLAGIPGRKFLRVRKQSLRRFAFVRLRSIGAGPSGIASSLDRMFRTVAPLGVSRGARLPRLDVPPPSEHGPILLAPGAGRPTKRWPAERFGEIARRLAEDGERVLVVGSAEERPLLDGVAAGAAGAEVLAVSDPAELPPAVARCPVALTNDSGLLHVAEACGTDVVALFGPTHPALGFAPLRAGSVAIHTGIACSPCDLHGPRRCPKRHHRCLRDVTVECVLAELRARRAAGVRA